MIESTQYVHFAPVSISPRVTLWKFVWTVQTNYEKITKHNGCQIAKFNIPLSFLELSYRVQISYQACEQMGGNGRPDHWIRNFVVSQKYIWNFAVPQKLWIFWPFFKKCLLHKQLLVKNHLYLKKVNYIWIQGIPTIQYYYLKFCKILEILQFFLM